LDLECENLTNLGAKTEIPGLICKGLYRWEDRHVIFKKVGVSLEKEKLLPSTWVVGSGSNDGGRRQAAGTTEFGGARRQDGGGSPEKLGIKLPVAKCYEC
jgi:hypothetical protein